MTFIVEVEYYVFVHNSAFRVVAVIIPFIN